MKAKSITYLLLVLVITVALGFGAYFGVNISGNQIIPGVSGMRMGLDIAGGVRLVYKPVGENITSEGLATAQTVFRKRLDVKGLNEATVTVDETNLANPMIIVEIPGFTDPAEASDFLGKTAKLQFVEPMTVTDEEGHTALMPDTSKVVMEGADVESAKSLYGADRKSVV